MRSALLLLWALAPRLAIQKAHGPIHSLSRRQVAVESSTTQISEEHIATSFSQVTKTYSSIRSSFVETSQTLYSQTSFEEASTTLTQFQSSIEESVMAISGGCDCDLAGVSTETIETTIISWFSQLQYMVQTCQQRFPSQISTFTRIFKKISIHLQVALGVAFVSGLDIQPIVTRAFQRAHIEQRVLSSVQIQVSSFTQISQAVKQRTGTFATVPPPVGRRFPERLQQVLTTARKSPASHNGTVPVDSTHSRVNGSAPQRGHKRPMPPADGLPDGTASNSTVPVDGHARPRPPTDGLTLGTTPNSTFPINGRPKPGHHNPGQPSPTPNPGPTRNPDQPPQETKPYHTPGHKPPTPQPMPGFTEPTPVGKPPVNSGVSPWSAVNPGSQVPSYEKKPPQVEPVGAGRQPSIPPHVIPWTAPKPAPGGNLGSGFPSGFPENHQSNDGHQAPGKPGIPNTGGSPHAGGPGAQPGHPLP